MARSLPLKSGPAWGLLCLSALGMMCLHAQHPLEQAEAAPTKPHAFEVRPEIAPAVGFWKRVYGEWTSEHVAFFDRHHAELVYEVLDLSPVRARSRNAIVFEILSKKKIAAKTREIRAGLLEWAKAQSPARRSQKTQLARRGAQKRLSPLAERLGRIISKLDSSHSDHGPQSFVRGLRVQTGQKDHVVAGLERSLPYLDTMERIFDEFGVPTEVTRLALIESSFNPVATSKAGAAGVWQFMEASSKGKLRVQPELGIDERRSPIKATRAAAQLLRFHHKLLGDWMLTVVSYNHGLRSFLKIPKKRRNSDELAHFFLPCNTRSPLGFASRNYYSEFLAFLQISGDLLKKDPHLRKWHQAHRDRVFPPVVFERVQGTLSAAQFARLRGLSLPEFRKLNPDVLRVDHRLPNGFWLALPLERPRAIRREARAHGALPSEG